MTPPGIKQDDYAFTVTDPRGDKWDVYHFIKPGSGPGTIVFRLEETTNKWMVGVLCGGHLLEPQVQEKLRLTYN